MAFFLLKIFAEGVTFPLMKKSDVNGDNTNEVFKWLKNEKAGILGLTRIKVCIVTSRHPSF
jgi:glutathione peroxidase-family protein